MDSRAKTPVLVLCGKGFADWSVSPAPWGEFRALNSSAWVHLYRNPGLSAPACHRPLSTVWLSSAPACHRPLNTMWLSLSCWPLKIPGVMAYVGTEPHPHRVQPQGPPSSLSQSHDLILCFTAHWLAALVTMGHVVCLCSAFWILKTHSVANWIPMWCPSWGNKGRISSLLRALVLCFPGKVTLSLEVFSSVSLWNEKLRAWFVM